jgi:multiple sugar transport system substrate-binding protein
MKRNEFLCFAFAAAALLTLGLSACDYGAGNAPAHLAVWWWGEQEAPGAERWMAETVDVYKAIHHNVTFETVLQPTDNLMPAFKTAAASREGPDIQFVWGGVSTLEEARAGLLTAASTLIPESEYRHYISNVEREYNGKVWSVGWYLSGNSIAFRKDLFKKAGLNPDDDYSAWPDFLAACAKLKAAGMTPIAGGLKDGWFGGWLWQLLGRQGLDSAENFKKATVGDAKLTDEAYAGWWVRLAELRDKGFWNRDITTLSYRQAQDLFVKGEAAMIFGTDTLYPAWISQVGADNLGVMRIPVFGKGRLASTYAVTARGLGITSWSKYPKQAADFLRFMHTPGRLEAWHTATGVLPADDRFDTSKVSLPQMRQVFDWIKARPGPILENFIPSMLDELGNFTGCQLLFAGERSTEQCAQLQEAVIARWRADNPQGVQDFRAWIAR